MVGNEVAEQEVSKGIHLVRNWEEFKNSEQENDVQIKKKKLFYKEDANQNCDHEGNNEIESQKD